MLADEARPRRGAGVAGGQRAGQRQASAAADEHRVSVLFAAFLGYNPMQTLLGPSLRTLSPARQATVTGHAFFPGLISGPFHHGLAVVFTFALIMCLIAAAASWLRGSAVRRAGTAGLGLRAAPAEAVPGEAVPGEAVPGEAVPGEAASVD